MRKPPIPAEENPRDHHERPGEPPANHEAAEEIGRGGGGAGEARNRELEEQSRESVEQPGG